MFHFINACKDILEIKRPVRIVLQNRIYRGYSAVHWSEAKDDGTIKCHVIKVSLKNLENDVRDMQTLIAHEFVHAWQAEYKPIKKKYHTPTFVKVAKILEETLNNAGFEVSGLYNPEIDRT